MSEHEIEVVFEDDEPSPRRSRDADRNATDNGALARQRLQNEQIWRQQALHEAEKAALTAKSEADAAEYAHFQASETGDYQKQAQASRAMSSAEAKLAAAEAWQEALRQYRPTSSDPFEDHLAKFTAPTAQWMREHKDWVEDPRKNSKLIGAHHIAVGDGEIPDTPSYFAHVEKTIGLQGNGRSSGGSVSRGRMDGVNPADARTHVNGDSVYLTANERKIATDGTLTWNHGPKKGLPLGLEEFARRKREMVKTPGWYDKL
jgi:hypothetical protein